MSYETTGTALYTLDIANLVSSTTYEFYVVAVDASNAAISSTQSSNSGLIQTEAAVTGEIASYWFLSAREAVTQKLRFFENNFPFVIENDYNAATNALVNKLSFKANSVTAFTIIGATKRTQFETAVTMNDVLEFGSSGGTAISASTIGIPTGGVLRVGGALTVGAASGAGQLVFADGLLNVTEADQTLEFGELITVSATAGSIESTSLLVTDGASTLTLSAAGAALSGSADDVALSKAGVANALTVQFGADGATSGPAFNTPLNQLRVDTVRGPSDGTLTLRDATSIQAPASDGIITLSGDGGGGSAVVVDTGAGSVTAAQLDATDITTQTLEAQTVSGLTTVAFDSTAATSISNLQEMLGLVTLSTANLTITGGLDVADGALVDLGDLVSVDTGDGRVNAVVLQLEDVPGGASTDTLVLAYNTLEIGDPTGEFTFTAAGAAGNVMITPGVGLLTLDRVETSSVLATEVEGLATVTFDAGADTAIVNLKTMDGVQSLGGVANLSVTTSMRADVGAVVEFGDLAGVDTSAGRVDADRLRLTDALSPSDRAVFSTAGLALETGAGTYTLSSSLGGDTIVATPGEGKLELVDLVASDTVRATTAAGLTDIEFSATAAWTSVTGLDEMLGLTNMSTSSLLVSSDLSVSSGALFQLGERVSVQTATGGVRAVTLELSDLVLAESQVLVLSAGGIELGADSGGNFTFSRSGGASEIVLFPGDGRLDLVDVVASSSVRTPLVSDVLTIAFDPSAATAITNLKVMDGVESLGGVVNMSVTTTLYVEPGAAVGFGDLVSVHTDEGRVRADSLQLLNADSGDTLALATSGIALETGTNVFTFSQPDSAVRITLEPAVGQLNLTDLQSTSITAARIDGLALVEFDASANVTEVTGLRRLRSLEELLSLDVEATERLRAASGATVEFGDLARVLTTIGAYEGTSLLVEAGTNATSVQPHALEISAGATVRLDPSSVVIDGTDGGSFTFRDAANESSSIVMRPGASLMSFARLETSSIIATSLEALQTLTFGDVGLSSIANVDEISAGALELSAGIDVAAGAYVTLGELVAVNTTEGRISAVVLQLEDSAGSGDNLVLWSGGLEVNVGAEFVLSAAGETGNVVVAPGVGRVTLTSVVAADMFAATIDGLATVTFDPADDTTTSIVGLQQLEGLELLGAANATVGQRLEVSAGAAVELGTLVSVDTVAGDVKAASISVSAGDGGGSTGSYVLAPGFLQLTSGSTLQFLDSQQAAPATIFTVTPSTSALDLLALNAQDVQASTISGLTSIDFDAVEPSTVITNLKVMQGLDTFSSQSVEIGANLAVTAGAAVDFGALVSVDTTLGDVLASRLQLTPTGSGEDALHLIADAESFYFRTPDGASNVTVTPSVGQIDAVTLRVADVVAQTVRGLEILEFDSVSGSAEIRNVDAILGVTDMSTSSLDIQSSLVVESGAEVLLGPALSVATGTGVMSAHAAIAINETRSLQMGADGLTLGESTAQFFLTKEATAAALTLAFAGADADPDVSGPVIFPEDSKMLVDTVQARTDPGLALLQVRQISAGQSGVITVGEGEGASNVTITPALGLINAYEMRADVFSTPVIGGVSTLTFSGGEGASVISELDQITGLGELDVQHIAVSRSLNVSSAASVQLGANVYVEPAAGAVRASVFEAKDPTVLAPEQSALELRPDGLELTGTTEDIVLGKSGVDQALNVLLGQASPAKAGPVIDVLGNELRVATVSAYDASVGLELQRVRNITSDGRIAFRASDAGAADALVLTHESSGVGVSVTDLEFNADLSSITMGALSITAEATGQQYKLSGLTELIVGGISASSTGSADVLSVGPTTITDTAQVAELAFGRRGVFSASDATETVQLGADVAVDTANGALSAATMRTQNITVLASAGDTDSVMVRAASGPELVLEPASNALFPSVSGSFSVSFGLGFDGFGTDAPFLNAADNALYVAKVEPSNSEQLLYLGHVDVLTSDATIRFATQDQLSQLELVPSSRSLLGLRVLEFDADGEQQLRLGNISVSAGGALDGVLTVGDVFRASTDGSVRMGEQLEVGTAAGVLTAHTLLATDALQAGSVISISSAGSAPSSGAASASETFLQHRQLQLSQESFLTPEELVLRSGAGAGALALCSSEPLCEQPAVQSDTGVLDLFANASAANWTVRIGTGESSFDTTIDSLGLSAPYLRSSSGALTLSAAASGFSFDIAGDSLLTASTDAMVVNSGVATFAGEITASGKIETVRARARALHPPRASPAAARAAECVGGAAEPERARGRACRSARSRGAWSWTACCAPTAASS